MRRMQTGPASVSPGQELVTLGRGLISLEIVLRPFAFTLRRAGRRLFSARVTFS